MVTTNDPALAERWRLRTLRSRTAWSARTWLDADGGNPGGTRCRSWASTTACPDVLCALGLSQLAKLHRFIARRRALARALRGRLAPLAPAGAARADARPGRPGAAPHSWR